MTFSLKGYNEWEGKRELLLGGGGGGKPKN